MKFRHRVWKRVTRIGIHRQESWVILGDFNDILHNGEKVGGLYRSENSFQAFVNIVKDCQMKELPSQGNPFTWSCVRHKLWIQCKLDRNFGNKEWFKMFPVTNQSFLEKRGSDHRVFLVKLMSFQDSYRSHFVFDKIMLHKPPGKRNNSEGLE